MDYHLMVLYLIVYSEMILLVWMIYLLMVVVELNWEIGQGTPPPRFLSLKISFLELAIIATSGKRTTYMLYYMI